MDNSKEEYFLALKGFYSRIENELTILLYHGVTNVQSKGIENYSHKHIPEIEFVKQMKYLKNHCNIISIDEYVNLLSNNDKLPRRSTIISFDDGFKNNYTIAANILDDLQIPAVFYVTSGVINTNLMFWVDKLEDCINLTSKKIITITLNNKHKFSLSTIEEKISALNSIKTFCKTCKKQQKDQIIYDVIKETDIEPIVTHSRNYEKLTWDDLNNINSNELFTVGGHGLYHDVLSSLDEVEIEQEITKSINLLEVFLEEKIFHYSYPEGQLEHYNDRIIKTLKDNSIVCSPSAIVGLNNMKSDPFHLKRIMVGFNGHKFPYFEENL